MLVNKSVFVIFIRSGSSCCFWICYGHASLSLSCNSHCTGQYHNFCLHFPFQFKCPIISATNLHGCLLKNITLFQVILLLGYGPDAPPPKVFLIKGSSASKSDVSDNDKTTRQRAVQQFSWKPVLHFIFWLFIWSCHVLLLSSVILKKVGGLHEMFEK